MGQIFLGLFLAYLLYQFIFRFLIPVIRVTRQVKRQVRDFHQQVNTHQNGQPGGFPGGPARDRFRTGAFGTMDHEAQRPAQKASVRQSEPGAKKDDYLDFEEVK